MTSESLKILEGQLKVCAMTDGSITDKTISDIINFCTNICKNTKSDPDFAISRKAAAHIIGKSVKTVDYYVHKGNLTTIKGKNCTRACGISIRSLSQSFGISIPHLLAALKLYDEAA